MDNRATTTCSSLLLNAEAFGFGPTAAIADFFPYLRRHFDVLAYVGKGHTLDLQRRLPYDCIYDLSDLDADREKWALGEIFSRYPAMLTALDFEFAGRAKAAGLKVAIYDPLTWFWAQVPAAASSCDMYIAQDFVGVRERIAAQPHAFASPHVVPAIVPQTTPQWKQRDKILINLGGLNNPLWSEHGTRLYARMVVESLVDKNDPSIGDSLVIACNQAIANELRDYGAQNLSREQMQDVLSRSRYALMTPGLGNIYDAARFGTPTIWLPPANDSQGQQLRILQSQGMSDGSVDWHEFMPGCGIDYYSDQQLVLGAVALNVMATAKSKHIRNRLARLFTKRCRELENKLIGNATALIFQYGSGGSEKVAELVAQFAGEGGSHA